MDWQRARSTLTTSYHKRQSVDHIFAASQWLTGAGPGTPDIPRPVNTPSNTIAAQTPSLGTEATGPKPIHPRAITWSQEVREQELRQEKKAKNQVRREDFEDQNSTQNEETGQTDSEPPETRTMERRFYGKRDYSELVQEMSVNSRPSGNQNEEGILTREKAEKKRAPGRKNYQEKKKEKRLAHRRRYRQENKEKIAAYWRQYRQENKEKLVASHRRYRQENKEKRLAYWRRYWQENKEKRAASNRRWKQENKEKIAASNRRWRQENKEKIAAYSRKYRQERKKKVSPQEEADSCPDNTIIVNYHNNKTHQENTKKPRQTGSLEPSRPETTQKPQDQQQHPVQSTRKFVTPWIELW